MGKRFRRLLSLLMAVVMTMGLSLTGWAADTTPYTITISNSTDGYVYTAYQIFTGVLSDDGKTLSDIEWGNGVSDAGIAAVKADTNYGTDDAAEVAKLITTEDEAKAFAEVVDGYLQNGIDSNDAGDTYTISVTGAGYYLIANTTVPTTAGSQVAYTNYIMKVVENVTVTPKEEVPTSDKTVEDINDSTETSGSVSSYDSADYDIGDNVPFTLTATLPGNYDSYDTYKLIFHDKMDDGLKFNNDIVVKVGDDVVDSSYYTVNYDANNKCADGCTFEVVISNTKNIVLGTDGEGNEIKLAANSVITVAYSAELLSTCVVGGTGNKNTSHIEYSNNPNWNGVGTEPTGETPDDTTTVFTFTLNVNKTDEYGNALTGATFTLYKYNVNTGDYTIEVGTKTAEGYQKVSITAFESGVTYYTYNATDNTYEEVTDTSGTPADGTDYYVMSQFIFKGLDDGKYMLVETVAPDGYNKMENLYFTVDATHTEDEITELVIKDKAGNTISGSGLTFTADKSDGSISTDIENSKGSTLPSTGGIGTTIFYVIGGILVAGAAVLLITKKRLGKME